MSTHSDFKDTELAGSLNQHGIPPPSPELKTRILAAAREAWESSWAEPARSSWMGPLLKFAASLTVAALMPCLADMATRMPSATLRAGSALPPSVVSVLNSAEVDAVSSLVQVFAAIPAKQDPTDLKIRMDNLRALLAPEVQTIQQEFTPQSDGRPLSWRCGLCATLIHKKERTT